MTTEVKVSVPNTANWKAVVTYHRPDSGDMIGYEYFVEPGQSSSFYCHDAQTVRVKEMKLESIRPVSG